MPKNATIRPTWVEIDLAALRHNARISSAVAQVPLFAVLKADAYGHGAVPVARALAGEPCVRGFAVSLVEEGVELREAGIEGPVLVMGSGIDRGAADVVQHGLTPLVSTAEDVRQLGREAARRARPVDAHVMIDTGMGRVGFQPGQLESLAELVCAWPGVRITGLATHFACADTDDPADPRCMTHVQIAAFERAVARTLELGLASARPRVVRHMANSAAALWFAEARGDFVRPGIALYGNGRGPREDTAGLRQVMRLCTRVTQLRRLEPGATVSYGALWRAPRATAVAVLPVGYADGVPRRMTGQAEVLVHGRRAPVIGAITMDTILIDVSDLGERVAVGDLAVVLGEQAGARISALEFAERAGCIEYEVTCGMSKRVPRVYDGNESGSS